MKFVIAGVGRIVGLALSIRVHAQDRPEAGRPRLRDGTEVLLPADDQEWVLIRSSHGEAVDQQGRRVQAGLTGVERM